VTEFYPVTKEQWNDFEELFGERGACGGCWCMWWRLKRSTFEQQKGKANREAMKKLIESGEIPGILAYQDRSPVGWCSVAPREKFSSLQRSRILAPLDDKPVWSVVCFFIAKPYQDHGLSLKLLQAAVDFVKKSGGTVIEGYPVEPKKDRMPKVFAWTGFASTFKKAGFVEEARRSATRPIMRYYL
jgi:GNAT superfamily N-acetyltransferase